MESGPKDGKAFNDKELAALLAWHGVPSKKDERKRHRAAKWQAIVDEKTIPPAITPWTEADEANLIELKKYKIDMSETAYGRHVALKKRELTAAASHMGASKIAELREALDEREAEVRVSKGLEGGEDEVVRGEVV